MQQCCNCGKRFPVEYCSDGTYTFVSDTCNCKSDFEPIEGEPSISEWLENQNQNNLNYK